MKHLTMRKMTAVQRIEINRFWNELEDIFDRIEDVKASEISTTEEAQNRLNETVECDNEVEAAFDNFVAEDILCLCDQDKSRHEEDTVSCYGSETSSHGGRSSSQLSLLDHQDSYLSFRSQDDFLSYQSKHQKPLPLPPSFQQTKTLVELFNKKSEDNFPVSFYI